MDHYDITLWIEYVREMLLEAEMDAMRAHLELPCEPCLESPNTR